MDILTPWLRSYLPALDVTDEQLAEDLTLRGIAVEGVFPLEGGGSRFEMDVTTNRVDAMNHYGVAREAAAIYNLGLRPLSESAAGEIVAGSPDTAPGSQKRDMAHPDLYPVRIEATDLCGRFTARVVRNVTVSPSRGSIAEWFAAIGQKPISNAVDITNFVWMAMGQPTHVFDLDTLEGGIVVRRARKGERLRLLDGSEKTLCSDDLVVADEKKALGLAGVMGGWDSRVTEATKNILVEAAWFDPGAIRATSRRHGLHTDASHRFERGADFDAAPLANGMVVQLLVSECGGEPTDGLNDIIVPEIAAKTAGRPAIGLRMSEVKRHLGTTLDGVDISAALVQQYLSALGCRFAVAVTEDLQTVPPEYSVTLPSWRLDLEREIDLIEEVARVYGYNRFANTLPTVTGGVVELPHAAQERAARETLLALGYSEAVSSTFVAEEEAKMYAPPGAGSVAMGNPLSAEAGMLRPSLAPGLAQMLALNLHRDVGTVRLFELGTVFTGSTAEVEEHASLCLGAVGGARATALHSEADALFYAVKGALEMLLARFDGEATFAVGPLPEWIAPGRGACVLLGGKPVAVLGELAAPELQRRKLRQTCVVAEVHAQTLLGTPLRAPLARELSRFQAVERDFSFVFPDTVAWQSIAASLQALNIPELQRTAPMEIFREAAAKGGGKASAVPAGSYSLLTRVVFQSPDRTLTEDELSEWSRRVTEALQGLGGRQRV
jgi:phenylalanyl-tRNA synthetase beta chain